MLEQFGGDALARHEGGIHLAEIIRLLDGALAPTESVSDYFYKSIEREKGLLHSLAQNPRPRRQ